MSSSTNQITVTCPQCQHKFPFDEVLTHQMEEQVSASLEQKHKSDIEDAIKLAEEKAEKNAKEQFGIQMARMQKETDEEKERNKKLTSQMSELLDEMKALRRKDEDREIEMKKKMMEDEERVRTETRKQVEDESRLKNLENEKKLNDALKQAEELRNRMKQGSQQTQGEVLELELEKALKQEFPMDVIEEVKKGERGADIVHQVVDKLGRNSGTILWESKNAQWKNDWISKFKEDQRSKKADLAVLVTIHKPEGLETFTYREGVWLTTWQFVVPLALALRFNLISLNHEKSLSEGKNEKKEILYQYLTGTEFKQRVEAIVEAFGNLQDILEKEKRWFNTKWAHQEKEMRKVLDHTHGMYGDLQGIIGRSLPQLTGFETEAEKEMRVLEEVIEE